MYLLKLIESDIELVLTFLKVKFDKSFEKYEDF